MLDHIAWDVELVDGRDVYGNIVYIYGDIVYSCGLFPSVDTRRACAGYSIMFSICYEILFYHYCFVN